MQRGESAVRRAHRVYETNFKVSAAHQWVHDNQSTYFWSVIAHRSLESRMMSVECRLI